MEVIVENKDDISLPEAKDSEEISSYLERANEELGETNRVISPISVDGETYDSSHESIKCGDANKIKLKVNTYEVLTIQSIAELGDYCKRYLNRLPKIIDNWEEKSKNQLNEYRDQVIEALNGSLQVLDSVNTLINIDLGNNMREDLQDRANKLVEDLESASLDELQSQLSGPVQTYITDLLSVLKKFLEELQEHQETLEDEARNLLERLKEVIPSVEESLDDLRSNQMQKGLSEFGEQVEIILDTKNTLLRFDQSGKLKSMFPSEMQQEIKETLEKFNEATDLLKETLKSQSETKIAETLQNDILPYLKNAREYFNYMVEQPRDNQD